jgi:hypothetical protein
MSAVDDIIGRWVKQVERTGELAKGRYWGKPLDLDDGREQTPETWRMAHRVLKNAGYVPAEVGMMQQVADLERQLDACGTDEERQALQRRIAELRQNIALRREPRRR